MRRKVEETTASRRARRSFTPSFKAEVVALVRQGDGTLPAICREMDLSETAVRRWVQQAAVDAGERDGRTADEREELRRLRREVQVLRDERDILKRATFFAMETDEAISVHRGGEQSVSGSAGVPDRAGLPRRLLRMEGGAGVGPRGRGPGADREDPADARA